MDWTKVLGILVAVGITAWAVGALVSLVINPLSGAYQTASAVVLLIVIAGVAGLAVLGAKNRRWLENPESYW